jgi:dTDP-4-dehydrorhamnose 3,5-epimerase
MHYQVPPHSEAKIVTCLKGSIYDVIIDLRLDSATYLQWFAVELRAGDKFSLLYVPEGFAHGFQTREDNTDVFYQMSTSYHPSSARGVRWNDPAFKIPWPEDDRVISQKDQSYPDFAG